MSRHINKNIGRRGFILLVCLILVAISLVPVYGTAYYVSTTGNDSNPGTLSQPWKTISKANSTLVAGDTVYIRAGNYIGTTENPIGIDPINNGEQGKPITYQAYPGETPIIKGRGLYKPETNYRALIHLINKEYIKLIGITIHEPIRRWFSLKNCNHIIFENMTFDYALTNSQYRLSQMEQSSFTQFINCSWDSKISEDSDTQHDLLALYESPHTLFLRCYFGNVSHATNSYWDDSYGYEEYTVYKDCIFTNKWRHGVSVRFDHQLVDGCKIQGVGRNNDLCPWHSDRNRLSPGIYFASNRYSIVRNNVIYGCDIGIFLRGAPRGDSKYNAIYHNTVYNTDGCDGNTSPEKGTALYGESSNYGWYNNLIVNNIFWKSENTKQFNVFSYGDPTPPSANTFEYNFIGDPTNLDYGRWGTGFYNVEWHDNNNPDGWNNNKQFASVDPLLNDPENYDFTLQPNSPAIDNATWLATVQGVSGITITVDDATPFFSGPGAPWYINHPDIKADIIYDDDGSSAVIQSIDYETNQITVDNANGFTTGDQITVVDYVGSAPDIGAYEYGGTGISKEKSLMPNSLSLSVNSLSDNSVIFNFTLETPDNYNLNVYNIAGKKVWCYNINKAKAGKHHINWHLNTMGNREVRNGIYFAVLKSGGNKISKYFVVLH